MVQFDHRVLVSLAGGYWLLSNREPLTGFGVLEALMATVRVGWALDFFLFLEEIEYQLSVLMFFSHLPIHPQPNSSFQDTAGFSKV